MRCKSCGANVAHGAAVCEFCGTTVDPPGPSRSSGSERRADVFARIKESAAYANRNSPDRHAALPRMSPLATVVPIIFFVVFIGGAGFIAVMMLSMAGIVGFAGFNAGGPLAQVPH